MNLIQKIKMQFHEYQSSLQYEPVEVRYHFKDLPYSLADKSVGDIGNPNVSPIGTIFSGAFAGDLLRAENVYGILSRAKTLNNVASLEKLEDKTKLRVLKRIALPDGSQLENDFDSAGRLIATRYPDGVSMAYRYDHAGHLSQVASTTGIGIDFSYDARGRIPRIRHSAEGTFHYQWDNRNNLVTVGYPDGSKAQLDWDRNSRLAKLNFGTEKIVFNRDKTGRLAGIVVNDRVDYEFPEEINNRVYDIHRVTGNGGTAEKVITPVGIFLLDGKQRITTKIGIDGQVTINRYGKDESLRSVWNFAGATVTEYYDDASFSTLHSNGLRTLHRSDQKRPLVYIMDPFGVSLESYDEEKRMVTMVSDKGLRSINKFDSKGWLVSIEHPSEGKTRFVYQDHDLLKKVSMQKGAEIVLNYEQSGQNLQKIICSGTHIDVSDLMDIVLPLVIQSVSEHSLTVRGVR